MGYRRILLLFKWSVGINTTFSEFFFLKKIEISQTPKWKIKSNLLRGKL